MTKTYPTSGKTIFKSAIAALLLIFGFQNTQAQKSAEISADVKNLLEFYEKQIYFTENKGQWSSDIHYRAEFPLGQALATTEGMLVGTYNPADVQARFEQGMREEEAHHNLVPFNEPKVKVKGHGWMLKFLNHSPSMTIESKTKHKDVFNFFSSDPAKSKTNASNYQEVWYHNVYNNVDVRYYPSAEGSLEYDMICKPGFNKNNIELQFDGIVNVTKKSDGSLVLETSVGEMTLPAPVAYQKINGEKKAVQSDYVVTGNNTIKFEIGAFDAAQTLIIDPIALRWATWINSGSSGDNHGHCIWVDPSDGAIYVVARVVGTTNNITTGAFDESANGNLETIIGKYLEPSTIGGAGTRVWQTYIGGSGDDNPYAMEQGPDGNLYITGYTTSSNFPLLGGTAFSGSSIDNRSQSGNDIFVLKINKEGNSIKSAVVGGNQSDGSFDLRITSSGDVVVGGSTASTNLATLHPGTGASNTNNGSNDILIFKINQDLSAISWIKNYGGSGNDQAMIMNLNTANGDIFVGGSTTSSNFPTTNPRQSSLGGSSSGFLQKLKSSGSTAWSSYFSSASGSTTSILCMEFNTTKNRLYFGGITSGLNSANISSSGVYDNSYNSGTNDFFAASMDTNQTFVAATYIGGSSNEVNMMGLNTDLNNDVYIFGYTNSTNFPTTSGALQSTNLGSNDKVFLKLSANLSSLVSSTYYGGAADDYDPVGERGIKFSNCRIYTIVTARSNNIPLTQGALTTTKSSSTSIYEPGLVVWANPPDLSNNTLTGNQEVCAGGTPVNIAGSVPSYILPTITRNGVTSGYPSLGVSITYQWQMSTDSVNWTNISGATSQDLAGSLVGPLFQKTFFRRVIGGDACVIEGSTDQIVVVRVLQVPGTVTNASCFNANNGSISISPSNGTAPYTYLWSNGATTQNVSNLASGNYTVTVSDAAGCSTSASFDVTQPNEFTVTCNPAGTYCVNNGGSISTVVSGGTAPFSYAWSNGATGSSVSGLGAGTYSVIVTDANGCTSNCSVTLGVPVASCSKTDALCFGGNSGTASVSVTGGTTPFTYLWSNGGTTASINGLTAGTYSVTVTASNGCTATCSVTVGQPASAVSVSCSKTDVSCFGGNNGSVSVSASGGTSGYSYLWNTGATTASVSGRTAGTYSVTVTDANGCTASCSVTVGQPAAALSASCSKTDVSCFGGNTGSVSVSASGGTSGYSYLWNTGATTASVSGRTAGTYSVTVTDANGCTASCSVTVGQPAAALSASCSKTDVLCFGGNTGSVSVSASGGTSGYSYLWNTGATTASVSGRTAGTYSVTVTDANGCTASCSVTVGQPAAALSGNVTSTVATCTQSNSTATANISGGTTPYSYVWSNGQTGASATGYAAGTYSVVVTDARACQLTLSFTVIKTNCPPVANDDFATTLENTPVTITVVSNDTDVDGNIDPSTVTQISSPSNGTVVLNPNGTFTYTPNSNFVGNDQFNYQVCDDGTPLPIQCDQATVFITITSVPTTIIDSIPEDSLITICMEDFVNLQGGISSISICGMPQNGTFTINGTCATYTPTANWNGTDNMCIVSCNASGVCDTTPIIIIVIPVNDPPVANDDYETTDENTPVTVTVVANDTDIDGNIDPSTVTVTSQPSNGTVVVNNDGTITYTPATNYVGTDQFDYQVCDDGTPLPALCDIATVFITIEGVPTVIIDSIPEDSLITICMEDFVNLQGGISSISVCGMPSNGTFTINGTCATYTPTANWNGTDNMCIVSCNASGVCDTTPIIIIVIPVNDPPVANDDYETTDENTPVTVRVVTNDTDIDGNIDPSTVTVTSQPSNGTVVVNNDGTITYTPATNYVGLDQFNYQVCDDGTPLPALCDIATVFITIEGVPTVIIDSIPEDSLITICMEDFVNLQGGISSISICGMPQNGTFTINGTCATYTPTANWNGTDNMCIVSCNASGVCDTTPITIIVIPVNDPPIAVDDSATTNEDVPVTVVVVTNDTDIDGNINPNTVTIISPPTNGTAVVNPDGSITYTPDSHYFGTDSLVYEVCDDGTPLPALCDQATVYINVVPVNLPPVAIDDINNTLENTPVSGNVITNDSDPDGDNISVSSNTNPSNGTVVVNPDGSYTYTPNTGYTGEDQFSYVICDNGVPGPLCDTAIVFIEIIPVTTDNNPPIANHDEAVTLVNVPVGGNVLTNDADPDGDNIILNTTPISNPSNGTVVLNPDGTFIYTPNTDYVGTDVFVYEICDDGVPSLCDQTTVCITILENPNGVDNDPPFAADDAYLTPVNTPVGGDLLINDFDPNGDPITINTTPVSGTQHGTVVINADGTFTYTPNPGYIGPDQFVYEICDNGGQSGQVLCAQGTAYITVYPVIDITVVATDASCFGYSDGSVNLTVIGGVPPFTYAWSNGATTEDLSGVPAGTYSVTVTDAFGLVLSGSATVGQPEQVVVSIVANGPTEFCAGNSVTLTANSTSQGTYLWSNGETTQSIVVTTSGSYSVTITDEGECSGTSAPVAVTVYENPVPVISAGGPTEFCDENSVILTSSQAVSYQWSTGETTQSITVAQSGSYTVTVTDGNGCVGTSAPVEVVVNNNPTPEVVADGPLAFCAGGSVILTAASNGNIVSYLWSNGETTQSITVSTAGTYSVVVTDANGCSGESNPVAVTVYENPVPVITPDGPTEFCDGGSVVLSASPAVMYVWSPNGETTQSITVSASGSYSVWVMDENGCEGTSAPVAVTVYENPVPEITADGPTTFCTGESVTLTSSEASGYLWSPNGETTQSISVSVSGSYTVTVTDANGCRGTSAAVDVVVNENPVPEVTADGPTTFCEGGSVTLTASASAAYVWSQNGQTTQSIVVNAAGVYQVTVTDENGCTGISNPVEVFVNPNPVPVVTADGPTTFCEGESVTLTSSEAATYVWSPNGELTQSITVSASGDYSVWVMDANGCEGTSAPVSVVVNNNPSPIVSANGPTEFCMGGSVVLTATDAASYVWSPNGETTQSITVAEPGTYYVTVTDANGCVGQSNPVVVTVNENPVPEISADGPLTFCEGGQVALISSEAASYVWTPNGETTQTIIVSASGSYSVAVIDENGCTGVSAAVDVVVNSNPVPVISADGPTSFCQGNSVTLTSSDAASYLWSPTGETTQSITVSVDGDYSVTVMDANGCSGTSATVTVAIITPPAPVVSADGPTTFCEGESVMLVSTSATGNVWSPNGETTQSIMVSTAGSYFVTVTENGCVGVSAPVDVVVNPNPTPTVSPDGPATFCQGGSVTLTSSPAASYLWSPNGETTQSITVSDAGSYYVIVFDENGCRGVSAPIDVVIYNNPVAVITPDGPTTFCAGGSVTLTASSAAGYLWSPNGETTQSIEVSATGDYSVTVTDANGCSGASAPVHVEVTPPMAVTVTASGPTEICEGETVTLTAVAPGATSYQWYQNGIAIPGATGSSITVGDFADFHVVVSNQYGCEANSPLILVKVGEVPNAYAGLDEVICPGESVTLTATGGEFFVWSNGATTQSITVSPEQATDYTVSVSNPFCGQVDVDTVNVSVAVLPIAAAHASDNTSLGNPVNFTDVSGDNSVVSWHWDFGDGTSSVNQNTHHTYDFEDIFTVILTVENQYGCSASDTVEVEIEQIILIPNIITPNNDGFNDALGVKNNGVDDYGITIFNRWGQIVYEREAREINWDGTTNSGVALEEGTYYYILKVNNPNGSLGSWEQTGFITLVR
jgi:gliding motility-associated-like protein